MALPFTFNDWWPVFGGPSTGRLILELFGEPADASTREKLHFTIRGGNHSSPDWQHKIGIWFEGVGLLPFLRGGGKVYTITGQLFSIDDHVIDGVGLLEVAVRGYSQADRDKGVAGLKVISSVAYDPLELIAQAAA